MNKADMGIIIDSEAYKPLKCTACGSTEIAKMVNQGTIKCLGCGKQKNDPDDWRNARRQKSIPFIYTQEENQKPHRDF